MSSPLSKTARNERVKITATWFNSVSIAALAVGCFAPVVAFASSSARITSIELFGLVGAFLFVSELTFRCEDDLAED